MIFLGIQTIMNSLFFIFHFGKQHKFNKKVNSICFILRISNIVCINISNEIGTLCRFNVSRNFSIVSIEREKKNWVYYLIRHENVLTGYINQYHRGYLIDLLKPLYRFLFRREKGLLRYLRIFNRLLFSKIYSNNNSYCKNYW